MKVHNNRLDSIEGEMKELKANLYAKFGKQIQLEYDEKTAQ
jgi:hypothetical protein